MPLPYKKVRYRYKKLGPKRKQRIAFVNNKVVEITGYERKNGWVRGHTKRINTRKL